MAVRPAQTAVQGQSALDEAAALKDSFSFAAHSSQQTSTVFPPNVTVTEFSSSS
jgi:hypothetical protein